MRGWEYNLDPPSIDWYSPHPEGTDGCYLPRIMGGWLSYPLFGLVDVEGVLVFMVADEESMETEFGRWDGTIPDDFI